MQPAAPSPDYRSAASSLWTSIDARVQSLISEHTNSNYGIARPRGMTMAIPIAGATSSATVGWLTSVAIFQPVRIIGWLLQSLVQGSISLDIQTSTVMADPSVAPTLTSMPGATANPIMLSNGYSAYATDTTDWAVRDIQGFSILHVIVVTSDQAQTQTVLGLQLQDLQGRTLQI